MLTPKEVIALHEKDIETMKASIEMMEAGLEQTGDVSSGGRITDYTADTIEHYKRTIASLKTVIEKLKTKEY